VTPVRVVTVARVEDLPGDVGPDTLVVSADPAVLAEAGRLGAHRFVLDDPNTVPDGLAELVAHLTKRSSGDPEPD
jgi:hypothetical protein